MGRVRKYAAALQEEQWWRRRGKNFSGALMRIGVQNGSGSGDKVAWPELVLAWSDVEGDVGIAIVCHRACLCKC